MSFVEGSTDAFAAADRRLVADAKSVPVGYDYRLARSTEIPQRWRRRLTE